MTKRYQLIIFDWDGTLVDSANRISECLARSAEDVGLDVLSQDTYKNIIGLGLPEAFRKLYPEIDSPVLINSMKERYSHHFIEAERSPSAFFESVVEGVNLFKNAGLKTAVATGKSRRGLDRILDLHGWHEMFDTTRCADETRSKPHPKMLFEILDQVGCSPNEAVMVGDTEYDMEMAQRAGIDRIAMGYGAHSMDRLVQYAPVLTATHFNKVIDHLDL